MATHKLAHTAEIDIAYRDFGKPDGEPLIFLHGFPDGPNAWDEVVDRLKAEKNGLRCIVPAMRGYGETMVLREDLVAGQTAAFAADLLALADSLGLAQFTLVGHDWGARAGYAFSVLHPGRIKAHLALSSTYGNKQGHEMSPEQIDNYWYQWFFQTGMGEAMLRDRGEELCEHIWHRWSPGWKFSKSAFKDTAAYWKNPQFLAVTMHAYRVLYGNALSRPAYAEEQAKLTTHPAPPITVRTLFGYGTEDHCVAPSSSEEQRKFFTGEYDRVAIRGTGHFPHREDPAGVVKLVERLLKG